MISRYEKHARIWMAAAVGLLFVAVVASMIAGRVLWAGFGVAAVAALGAVVWFSLGRRGA
jgi:hypothetical protein